MDDIIDVEWYPVSEGRTIPLKFHYWINGMSVFLGLAWFYGQFLTYIISITF